MKVKFFIFLILISSVTTSAIFCQADPPLRIEIDTKSDEANYKVLPCGQNGALMFYQTTLTEDSYNFWVFVLQNKFLQESWKIDVPIYENMKFANHLLKDGFIYLFYFDPDKKKSSTYNYQLLKIELSQGRYELFSGLLPDNSKFAYFEITGNLLLVGLNIKDHEAGLYSYNFDSKETNAVHEVSDKFASFEGIFPDTLNDTYSALFNIYASKTEYYLELIEFGMSNEIINTTKITPESGKKLNTGKISFMNEGVKLLFGTYDFIKGTNADKKDYFVKACSGFYTVNLSDGQELNIRYHNFLDFENMTGYLKSKEYQEAKKKLEKNEDKEGKYSVTYDLLLHDIYERDSMFYFVGEAYFEEYHTVTSTYYDYYGRAVPVSYSVFDGYRFFNAFVSCFDRQGNKVWDNGMEIFNILSFDLKKRVNVFFERDDIILSYNRDGKISAKIINGPEVVEGVESFEIETLYGNDKIVSDSKSEMTYWYDNYFIAYGFQTIKNNSLPNRNKRTVFYINKVAFE
ncbi:MAG: hypothetical protein R2750_07585 [Bacteroidales bacterium]